MLALNCLLCGEPQGGGRGGAGGDGGGDIRGLCAGCAGDIRRAALARPCPLCGEPMDTPAGAANASGAADASDATNAKEEDDHCANCARKPPPLARLYVNFAYQPPLDTLILRFKYGGGWHLAKTLAALLQPPAAAKLHGLDKKTAAADTPAAAAGATDTPLVIPIPLHKNRERSRGYNQARELARAAGLSPQAGLLTRVIDTPQQAGLPNNAARKSAIAGAFQAAQAVHGRRVLLVDDVMTSGATLYEAARALNKAGAKEITAIVAARTLKNF